MNKSSDRKNQATPERNTEEQKLQRLFQMADVHGAPSAALSRRVTLLAAQNLEKQQRRHGSQRVLKRGLAICAAAALLFCVIRATPFVMAELFIRRVEAAVGKVQSAHIITWKVLENGERVRTTETWQQNSLYRSESWPEEVTGRRREIKIFRDGKLWTYEPELNKVTLRRQNTPYGTEDADLTGTGLIRTFTKASVMKTSMSVTTEHTNFNGQPARRVRIKTTGRYESYDTRILVDDSTDLPISVDMEVLQEQSGKKLTIVAEFDFNRPLTAELFEPTFPKTARLFDYDNGKEEWRKRLATGIASRKVGERTIVIRDFQVNDEGDVFMLYTAGKRPDDSFRATGQGYAGKDWKISLTDEFGTHYESATPQTSFQPMSGNGVASVGHPDGYTFEGERLEGDCWIPLSPQSHKKPRRFTVTFNINRKNLHGQWEGPELKANLSETVKFTFPVDRPTTAVVPDYMPYMFIGVQEERLQSARAEVRGLLPPGVEESPELVFTLSGNTDTVQALTFSSDGKTVASGAWDSGTRAWNVRTGKLLWENKGRSSHSSSVEFSPDGKSVEIANSVVRGKDYVGFERQLLDAATGRPLQPSQYFSNEDWIGTQVLLPDGKMKVSVNTVVDEEKTNGSHKYVTKMSARVRMWDAKTGKLLQTRVIPHEGFMPACVLLPDGALATIAEQVKNGTIVYNAVRLWNVQTGEFERELQAPERFKAFQLHVSPDGKRIAASGQAFTTDVSSYTSLGSRIHIWDRHTGELLQTIKGAGSGVSRIAFSADWTMLAREDKNKVIDLLDVSSGRQLNSLVGHGRSVAALAFSPDGKTLASGDLAGIVKLWRIK
jgi:WD40 repeat protein/outer membrane lipoprotein-sorting protein